MPARDYMANGGRLARVLPGYESRPEQLRMTDAVEEALKSDTSLLVEAGTGTGKSLAYLIPAALIPIEEGRDLRVVISTATKALGEQLMEKDLPTLNRLGLHPDVTLVKGLSNYVCRRRLNDYRQAVASGHARAEPGLDRILDWVEEVTEAGDRAELDAVPEEAPVWREVTSSSDTRIGPKCRYYEECFVTKMRRRAEASQIVVTNHHLFCADMALRGSADKPTGAQALPDFDAVIFDEAHALEDVATEFFGVRITRGRIDALVRDAERAFDASGYYVDRTRAHALQGVMAAMTSGAVRMFSNLPRARPGDNRVLLSREMLVGELGDGARQLADGLAAMAAAMRDFVSASDSVLSVWRRTDGLLQGMRTILSPDGDTHVAFAEPDARGGGAVGASPVEVGPILAEKLWARRGAVVLTSATLSTAGAFGFIRQRLGVPEEARELSLASPFDFGAQAGLYVPRKIPEPRDADYLDAAAEEVRRLVDVTHGGGFVLCTSVRVMRALGERLRGTWPYPTWVQGEAPKRTLLERFRAAGDGMLFATSSFWEGVDVPGHALRLVIMDKLPFDAPNDPVTASRIARLTARGKEPFTEYQVPAAALALKQGFGRLIRTRRDVGIVAILDRRLLTRGYGKTLLASLPPAARCATIDEVRAFWAYVNDRPE